MDKKENKKIEKNEELQRCETERQEYLDGWKRAKADFINYKKEEGERFKEFAKFAAAGLVEDLIQVLDSFDLATDLPKGALLIRQQLEEILKKQGVERVKAEGGMAFDPNLHEALLSEESDQPAETILEEITKGYTLNGRVIRASKVKISKTK